MKTMFAVMLAVVFLASAAAYALPNKSTSSIDYYDCEVTNICNDLITVTVGQDDYTFYGDGFNVGDIIYIAMKGNAIINASHNPL